MRWTDLPAGSSAADARAPGLRRAEWEQLRRRLERLPAGHPSSPDDDGPEAEAPDADDPDAEVLDGDAGNGQPGPADGHDRDRDRPDDRGRGPGGERRDRGTGTSRPGGDRQPLAAAGPREPYRPWFVSGEPADPWFTAEAEGRLL
jgi:hypothetical protein